MIETERLILRKFKNDTSDLQALYEILSDIEVNKYLPWWPVQSLAENKIFYEERILKSKYFFAICLKTDDLPIGYIDVSEDSAHDFGYGLSRKYWNQGIATEAATGMIQYLKNEGVPYITATHDRENIGSGKVMQKLGMYYEYSYEELWQPKNYLVTFRMYQLNFQADNNFVYQAYWDKYSNHFIETDTK